MKYFAFETRMKEKVRKIYEFIATILGFLREKLGQVNGFWAWLTANKYVCHRPDLTKKKTNASISISHGSNQFGLVKEQNRTRHHSYVYLRVLILLMFEYC